MYFLDVSCTISQENVKVLGESISCHAFVLLLPYRTV